MWEFHIPRIDIWGYLAGVAVGVAMVVDVVGYMLKLAVGVAVVGLLLLKMVGCIHLGPILWQ
jgi:hypothetical protein